MLSKGKFVTLVFAFFLPIFSTSVAYAITDATGPVLSEITFIENGQTLTTGDTCHITVKAEDESGVASVTSFWGGVQTKIMSFVYNESTGLWEGAYTFGESDVDGKYDISSIWAHDNVNNQGASVYYPDGCVYFATDGTKTICDIIGHNEVIDAAKAATCTETGLAVGKHCSFCNEVLVAQIEVPVIILPGDATNDGSIDIMDLVTIIDYIVSNTDPSSLTNADANGDGTVDIMDLVWIIDMIVGGS